MGHGGIIDRQQLNHVLAGSGSPVYHQLKVVELAYAKAVFTAQGEYRNGYACATPSGALEHRLRVIHDYVGLCVHIGLEYSVGAVFPLHGNIRIIADNQIFILKISFCFDGIFPYRVFRCIHEDGAAPVAEVAADSKPFAGAQGRCANAKRKIA